MRSLLGRRVFPREFFLGTFVFAFAFLAGGGCQRAETAATKSAAAPTPTPAPVGNTAVMETDKGTIEIQLLASVAPKTVENFRLLAQRGYYNGLTFHRIVKGFMLQGGDPLGDGRGGESAWGGTFADEIDRSSPLYQGGYKRGQVAMANSGPNTNTSQFFIMHQNYPLAPGYTIFGQVTKGIEVVDALANTPTKPGPGGEPSTPIVPPKILKVTIRP